MATMATMAIKLQAMTDQANRQLEATSRVVENVGRQCEVANQRTQMLQNSMGNTSKMQAFTTAMQKVTEKIADVSQAILNLKNIVSSAAKDVDSFLGRVLELSTGLPVARALSSVLSLMAKGLKFILIYIVAIGASTVFVSYLKGISFSAAFATVSINHVFGETLALRGFSSLDTFFCDFCCRCRKSTTRNRKTYRDIDTITASDVIR